MVKKMAIAVLAVVTAVLVVGAVASATSRDKVQDVVQVLVVNDTGRTLTLGLCHNRSCSAADRGQLLTPGDTYDQAVGPYETQWFAVTPENAVRSSAVPGKSFRCTRLVSGARVAARYPISRFVGC